MINFEDGVLVTPAKVNQDGTITPAQYSGKTPLSAYNLNRMQKLTECITGKSISASTIEGACKIKKVYGDLEQESEPAIDTPAKIKVVGDNVNLFNKSSITANVGVSYDTGSEYSNNTIFSTDYISINGIENLVWNGDSNSTNTWGAFYDENKTYLQGINVTNKKLTITNASAKYIKLTFLNEYLDTLKIEKGKATTNYTSYGNGGIDYKVANKNMLGLIDGTYTQNGITVVVKAGKITINGTATDVSLVNIPLKNEITIPVKTTYLLQAFNTSVPAGDNRLRLVTTDGSNTYNNCFLTKENSTSLIESDTTEYTISHLVYRSSSGAVYNNFVVTPQLVLGETAQDYEFHKSQSITIELPNGEFMAKIGDVEDYIDNKGILHKYIKKVILTGAETFYYNSNYNYFVYGLSNIKNDNNNVLVKSTHFIGCKKSEIDYSEAEIYTDNGSNLYFVNTGHTTVDDFKAWLTEQYANGTPVIIYYVLATPYEVDLDYNNILPQYKELTNIICSATSEIEFANNPAIASVNESISKISDETVAVNPNQPTDKKIWIQKCKNLFNKNAVIRNHELKGTIGIIEANEEWFVSDFIKVEGNTDYYISGGRTQGTSNAFYDENYNYLTFIQALSGTIKSPAKAKYMRFNGLMTELDSDIQIEQGTTATPYEEYIDNKIYIKNRNGKYEEFINTQEVKNVYSLEEKRIGIWIDGKPLYRKVIVFPNGIEEVTPETGKVYNISDFGITNAEEIHFVHPSYYSLYNRNIPFPFSDGNTFGIQVSPTQLIIICTYEEIASNKMVITLQYTKATDVSTTSLIEE